MEQFLWVRADANKTLIHVGSLTQEKFYQLDSLFQSYALVY